ncbi:MAG: hypothetical protein AB7K09_18200 [Planctomycetota bacterium]
MAEIEIKLIFNRQTGKKDVIIWYESDSDSLPIEHEEAHNAVVEKLLDKGVLKPDEVGNIKVERIVAHPPSQTEREQDGGAQTEKPIGS